MTQTMRDAIRMVQRLKRCQKKRHIILVDISHVPQENIDNICRIFKQTGLLQNGCTYVKIPKLSKSQRKRAMQKGRVVRATYPAQRSAKSGHV